MEKDRGGFFFAEKKKEGEAERKKKERVKLCFFLSSLVDSRARRRAKVGFGLEESMPTV